MICKWYVNDTYMICEWYVNDMWMICKWHVNDMKIICDWCVNDMWMMCKWYVNDIDMIWKWYANFMWHIYIYIILSYLHVVFDLHIIIYMKHIHEHDMLVWDELVVSTCSNISKQEWSTDDWRNSLVWTHLRPLLNIVKSDSRKR